MDESTVEKAALSWFWEMGYTTLFGPDIAPGELKTSLERKGDASA